MQQLTEQQVVIVFKLLDVGGDFRRKLIRINFPDRSNIFQEVKEMRVLVFFQRQLLQLYVADVALREPHHEFIITVERKKECFQHPDPDLIMEINLDGV